MLLLHSCMLSLSSISNMSHNIWVIFGLQCLILFIGLIVLSAFEPHESICLMNNLEMLKLSTEYVCLPELSTLMHLFTVTDDCDLFSFYQT